MATNQNQRNSSLQKAIAKLNIAAEIDVSDQLSSIVQAQLEEAQGNNKKAIEIYSKAKDLKCNGQTNIAPLIALANLCYESGEYKQALARYQDILKSYKETPPEIRLGIACCFYQLGYLEVALKGFLRVLQLDSKCIEAYIGLAEVHFCQTQDPQKGLKDGVYCLLRAYQIDPHNPGVLMRLAQLAIIKGQHEQAKFFAQSGLETKNIEPQSLKVQLLTILGRAFHAQGLIDEASNFYQQASQIDPNLSALQHIGSAQVHLQKKQEKEAIQELENTLKLQANNPDALKLFGLLYQQVPNIQPVVEKLLNSFSDASSDQPYDCHLKEFIGNLLATNDPKGALTAYTDAIETIRQNQPQNGYSLIDRSNKGSQLSQYSNLTVKLLNNAAVLNYRAGQVDTALELLDEALRKCNQVDIEQEGLSSMSSLTLGYNRARLLEVKGNYKEASREYQDFLNQFPGYIDCYLRLACIARHLGNIQGALQQVNRALKRDEKNLEANALLGQLYLERKDWANAKDVFYKLVKGPIRKDDTYGSLGLANVYFYSAPRDRKKPDNAQRFEQHLTKALELYDKVLLSDRSNIYAANGIGAIIAEFGELNIARDIFQRLQETVAATSGYLSIPDITVNLANIQLAMQNYVNAKNMYMNALSKVPTGKSTYIMIYLARAQYDSGNLEEATKILLKAIHLAPINFVLRFNLGLCLQEQGVRVLRKKFEGRESLEKARSYQQAVQQLSLALQNFKHLIDLGYSKTALDIKKLQVHVTFCQKTIDEAKRLLTEIQTEIDLLEKEKLWHKSRLEAAEAQRQEEEERKKQIERKVLEERQRQYREAQEKAEKIKADLQAVIEANRKPVRDKDGYSDIDMNENLQVNTDQMQKPPKKRKKGKKGKDEYEDEDQDQTQIRNKKKRKGEYDQNEGLEVLQQAGLIDSESEPSAKFGSQDDGDNFEVEANQENFEDDNNSYDQQQNNQYQEEDENQQRQENGNQVNDLFGDDDDEGDDFDLQQPQNYHNNDQENNQDYNNQEDFDNNQNQDDEQLNADQEGEYNDNEQQYNDGDYDNEYENQDYDDNQGYVEGDQQDFDDFQGDQGGQQILEDDEDTNNRPKQRKRQALLDDDDDE